MNKKNVKGKTLKRLYRELLRYKDNPIELKKVELKIKTLEKTKK
jgi:hypothetical protein